MRTEKNTKPETITLPRGIFAGCKVIANDGFAKTYANRTQAIKAAAKLGEGYAMIGHRPFYVAEVA